MGGSCQIKLLLAELIQVLLFVLKLKPGGASTASMLLLCVNNTLFPRITMRLKGQKQYVNITSGVQMVPYPEVA